MTDMYAHVNIKILEKEYQVQCPADERKDLMDSADLLNAQMREIRDSGKVVGLDRIAVMAALNIANDLIRSRTDEGMEDITRQRIQTMCERVEDALGGNLQLDL